MPKPTPSAAAPHARQAEARIVTALIAVTLLLASLPYLWGYAVTPPGFHFVGTAYNIDDYCNYLSWLRQTMDGHFFLRNQFTTEAQRGLECNIFFWLLGRFAHTFGLSPQAALQVARVCGGAGLLFLTYRLYRFCLPRDQYARLTAFGFVCLSSGWGWLNWQSWADKNLAGSPTDAWQPEAYTFLSVYTSALFTASTLLIVGALFALLQGEMTGRRRFAVLAGVCGALLGNMHSYDVLHLAAAWGLYLIAWTGVRRGKGVGASWGRGVLALALTLPTTVYQYWVFQREAVFHQRAEVATPSPAFWHYVLGYGVVFVLSALALPRVVARLSPTQAEGRETRPLLLALCWAVAGLCVIYLPVAFQRKMLMGTHIPLCLLAGVGASMLTESLKPRVRTAVLAVLVLLSLPSNLLFLRRDIAHITSNRSETQQQPFLSDSLIDAYQWIDHFTPPGAAVVSFPTLCAPLPAYAGHPVWAGHWGETPRYAEKAARFTRFADSSAPDVCAQDSSGSNFLLSTHAEYLLYPNSVASLAFTDRHGRIHAFSDFAHAPPSCLTPVYANRDFTLLRIKHARALSLP